MQKSTAIDVVRLARAVAVGYTLVGLVLLACSFGYNAVYGSSLGAGMMITAMTMPVTLYGVLWIVALTIAKWIVGRMRFD